MSAESASAAEAPALQELVIAAEAPALQELAVAATPSRKRKYISLTTDFGFKRIVKNPVHLKHFLSSVLDVDFDTCKLGDSVADRDTNASHGAVFDIRCTIKVTVRICCCNTLNMYTNRVINTLLY